MPAAILIPLAIQAGASVGKALIEKHAAGKAAKQMEAAGERARQDLAPYANAGARAATTLSDLTFGGPAAAPRPMAPGPAQPPPGSMAGMMTGRGQGGGGQIHRAFPGQPPTQGPPPPGSMAAMGRGASASQSGYAGQGVQMQAPDGRVVMVPQDQVQAALANGGRQVG